MYLFKGVSLNRVRGLAYRQALLYWRHLDRKLEIAFWPVIDALMFGAIGTYAARNGGSSAITLMLSGFLMAQLVWQSHIQLTKFFLQEVWDWNVLYLMTRPIRTRELFVSALAVTSSVALCASTFVWLVSVVTFHLHIWSVPIGFALLIPMLMMLGWSTALFATAIVVRLGQKADNFVWAMFGLIGPLSGFVVPVNNLPVALRWFGELLPTTHAYQAGRAMLFADTFPWGELAIAGVGTLTLFGLACWTVSRNMHVFRSRGLVSRYV
jgi:ABC-2 type transport system permease protein